MPEKKIIFFATALSSFCLKAQETVMDTLAIADRQLGLAAKVQTVQKISSKDFTKNSDNLSGLLRFNSSVYIRENGRGMTSSPSFRGTTAQQTGFVWNGINVNSMFLGQGDVNNLGLFGYDSVEIKPGGGSVVYGSGAIGGSVHLNTNLPYDRGWNSQLFLEAGSFSTFKTLLKNSFSDEKFSYFSSVATSESKNNYEVPRDNYVSRNAQYHNTSVNFGAAYRLNSANEIFWQSQIYDGVQHFPQSSENSPKTMYGTDNFRSLLGWNFKNSAIRNSLSAAFLEENFRYFPNILLPEQSRTDGKTYLLKNDLDYRIDKVFSANILAQVKKETASSQGSGIGNPERFSADVAALLRAEVSQKFYAEAGIKKNKIEGVSSPWLYSFGLNYRPVRIYTLKLSASKNFRAPDFYELYWKPGGNPDLRPEISHQAEISNEFKLKNFSFSASPYFIFIKNMIEWLPTNSGYWQPINVGKMRSFGVETQFSFRKIFGNNAFDISGGLAYTNAKNLETGKKQMYVPELKSFATVQYRYRKFSLYFQAMFNGKTYTTTDENESEALKPYALLNGGANFSVLKNLTLGFKSENIGNTVYSTVSYYPMPGRSYSGTLSFKF